jgi:hypothetical protein
MKNSYIISSVATCLDNAIVFDCDLIGDKNKFRVEYVKRRVWEEAIGLEDYKETDGLTRIGPNQMLFTPDKKGRKLMKSVNTTDELWDRINKQTKEF